MSATKLGVPVNPAYDFDREPQDNEFAYVNPVTLNNHQILLANEMARLADVCVAAMRANAANRKEKRLAERELRDREEGLLAETPLTATEAKNLQTTNAAIVRRAQEVPAVWQQIQELRQLIRQYEDAIDDNEALIERAQLYWKTADRMGEAIKTHLSYVKDDRKRAYAY